MQRFTTHSESIRALTSPSHIRFPETLLALVIGLVCLFPHPTWALDATQKKQALSGGEVQRGHITKGKFTPKDSTKESQSLTDATLTDGSVTNALVEAGALSGDVAASGVSITNATLSNAIIENAAVSGVAGTGTLSDAELSGATVNHAQFKALESPTNVAVSREESNIPFKGDRLKFKVRIPGFVDIDDKTGTGQRTAQPSECFKVADEDQDSLTGHFMVDPARWYWSTCYSLWLGKEDGTTYKIQKSALQGRDYSRVGFTYGVLVVPFKYDSKTKSFEQGGTLGPYLAFGEKNPGFAYSWTFFAGATQAAVQTTQNNVTTTSTQNGYSVATGPMVTIKGTFTLGLFIGKDFFQQSSRTWWGLNFGVKAGN